MPTTSNQWIWNTVALPFCDQTLPEQAARRSPTVHTCAPILLLSFSVVLWGSCHSHLDHDLYKQVHICLTLTVSSYHRPASHGSSWLNLWPLCPQPTPCKHSCGFFSMWHNTPESHREEWFALTLTCWTYTHPRTWLCSKQHLKEVS